MLRRLGKRRRRPTEPEQVLPASHTFTLAASEQADRDGHAYYWVDHALPAYPERYRVLRTAQGVTTMMARDCDLAQAIRIADVLRNTCRGRAGGQL